MATCSSTLLIAIVILLLSVAGYKFSGVRMAGLAGGLGAVVLILALFGVGC